MPHDVAFDVPVVLPDSAKPIKTVEQAAQVVRSLLQAQFTIDRLTVLLALERAAEGSEVAEARQAFCMWACKEQSAISLA
jgi:hypothetical protein